jgi:small-conductance mechanosensitive channel
MGELWADVSAYFTADRLVAAIQALLLLFAGLLVAKLASRALWNLIKGRVAAQQSVLLRRVAFYGIGLLFAVAAFHQLGFKLGVLLGAAGVVSVAIGFASQTSASNLISGLFLIAEQPFDIGDVIQVGGTTGEVLAIDLMSVKLRTFDNLFVRIPNEMLIKAEVRTLTRFPIRRLDLQIGVAYQADLQKVQRVLFDLADRNPLCLDEPKPLLILQGFGDSAIQVQFSPWATRENFLELKNTVQMEIKRRFEEEGIEIPFPQRTLHTSSDSAPIPVRVVEAKAKGAK